MKIIYLTSLIIIFCLSSCFNIYKIKSKEDTFVIASQYRIGQTFNTSNITTIGENTKIITEFDETSQMPCGRKIYIDSNNITRKIEWYHKKGSPFYSVDFNNLFLYTNERYSEQFVDTSLLVTPEFRYELIDKHLYIESFSKYYPIDYIEFSIGGIDTLERIQRINTTNTCYFEIIYSDKSKPIDITCTFYNDSYRILKVYENIILEVSK